MTSNVIYWSDVVGKPVQRDSPSVSREAQPVEDESTLWEEVEEEEQEEEDEEDEMLIQSEEGESPEEVSEDGSGGYEGSAGWGFVPFEGDKGSGESWTEEGNYLEKQPSFDWRIIYVCISCSLMCLLFF